jgi:hypothetical protein
MSPVRKDVRDDDRPELKSLLEERIYEFNSSVTGIHDGVELNASVSDEVGTLVAGLFGPHVGTLLHDRSSLGRWIDAR